MDETDIASPEPPELEELRQQARDLVKARRELEHAQRLLRTREENERRFTEQLSSLVCLTSELSTAPTVDDICCRAVEWGRATLSFDRIGIWLRADDPELIRGTWGVDENGLLQDERHLQAHISPESPEGRILLAKEAFVLVERATFPSSDGTSEVTAPQLFAALWDGEKVIGHVSADNLLRDVAMTRNQCELLRMFGTIVGYLCSKKRSELEREELIAELKAALKRIKTLQGLIPICAECRRIRDDEGSWTGLETYVREHSEAEFSHGLCPECLKKVYAAERGEKA
ncbi:MAG TPA: hypothetical protein PLD73_09185 [Candidatus Hydrogenedentes bacterium]|jgi:hypothetical protein|nr:hypothetical protein [Candidatus Hydrogenedentota bacterium]